MGPKYISAVFASFETKVISRFESFNDLLYQLHLSTFLYVYIFILLSKSALGIEFVSFEVLFSLVNNSINRYYLR